MELTSFMLIKGHRVSLIVTLVGCDIIFRYCSKDPWLNMRMVNCSEIFLVKGLTINYPWGRGRITQLNFCRKIFENFKSGVLYGLIKQPILGNLVISLFGSINSPS